MSFSVWVGLNPNLQMRSTTKLLISPMSQDRIFQTILTQPIDSSNKLSNAEVMCWCIVLQEFPDLQPLPPLFLCIIELWLLIALINLSEKPVIKYTQTLVLDYN